MGRGAPRSLPSTASIVRPGSTTAGSAASASEADRAAQVARKEALAADKREVEQRVVLSCSYGFGGMNAAIVLGHPSRIERPS